MKTARGILRCDPKTFHGRCLAIVRSKGAAGVASVRATADGLPPAAIVVRVV